MQGLGDQKQIEEQLKIQSKINRIPKSNTQNTLSSYSRIYDNFIQKQLSFLDERESQITTAEPRKPAITIQELLGFVKTFQKKTLPKKTVHDSSDSDDEKVVRAARHPKAIKDIMRRGDKTAANIS